MESINEITKHIWETLEGSILALYFTGSRVYGAEIPSSDWDFFGIVNERYDFENEEQLNSKLSEKSGKRINFRGISWEELQGGKQEGIITKYVPLPVLLRGFHLWKLLIGKKFTLKDFKVRIAVPKEEFTRNLERLEEYRELAEKDKLPFRFGDYMKTVMMLVEAEQEMRGLPFTMNYQEIANREKGSNHIVQTCIDYRNGKDINRKRFFEELDKYLGKVKKKYQESQ